MLERTAYVGRHTNKWMPRVSRADSCQGFNGSGETAVPAKALILAKARDWPPNLHVLQKYGRAPMAWLTALTLARSVGEGQSHPWAPVSLNSWATPLRAALHSSG